ncbi:hypothetical protein QYM36_010232 [Artemia franciscana]|uniref:RGS domain-containing protein n=1 Tax=Artemia franciscana TaxID=6661 RepID=A0AA88HTQ6_ARTSF|nr:hypothetical protein QYM36_010232 [Artemia franciscana]
MENCVNFNQSELASAISRVDRKIVLDSICRESVEHILNSVEMKDLFKLFLNCSHNSQNHYLDFYERAKNLDVSLNAEELKRLYSQFLDHSLPKTKKINVATLNREKRFKIRSYMRSPEPSKVEEVRIILQDVIQRVFDVLDEVSTTILCINSEILTL